MITRYTTAPTAFDGFGTIDRGIIAETDSWFGAPKQIRKVEIQPLHLGWQENRYWSGNHPSWDVLPPSAKLKK